MKTAIIIGASGLVGGNLLDLLIEDDGIDKIIQFGRKGILTEHAKVKFIPTDFNNLGKLKDEIKGDILFSCLGTTLQKAGSKDAQFKVDFTYQYDMAKFAAENGVKKYLLVSAVGAHQNSRIFYSKMKGMLEQEVNKLSFQNKIFIRPSVLSGKRDEQRLGEQIGVVLGNLIQFIPFLRKYRTVSGKTVAKSLLALAKADLEHGKHLVEPEEIFEWAERLESELVY